MQPTLEQALSTYLCNPCRIAIDGHEDSIHFFVYEKLGEDMKAELADYVFDDAIQARVDSGALVPIAVLGLVDRPSSFAELNHGGALYWQADTGSVWFRSRQEDEPLRLLAPDLGRLTVMRVEEAAAPNPSDDLAVLRSPAYAERWERLGDLRRAGNHAEALALTEELLGGVPGINCELLKMKALLLVDLDRKTEALAEAADLEIMSLGDPLMSEFLARIQLKTGEYSAAQATAEKILADLDSKENPKLQAAALAIKGIAIFHRGDKTGAKESLERAKALHAMVIVKYPEVRTLLASC
jgi:tetratricopeptide (TPR) repeat protein